MQPIFRKELTKRAQLIYYHFTTIWAETGSFRSIRTVFSEKIFSRKRRKIRLQIYHHFANFYYHFILGLFCVCINILKNA